MVFAGLGYQPWRRIPHWAITSWLLTWLTTYSELQEECLGKLGLQSALLKHVSKPNCDEGFTGGSEQGQGGRQGSCSA